MSGAKPGCVAWIVYALPNDAGVTLLDPDWETVTEGHAPYVGPEGYIFFRRTINGKPGRALYHRAAMNAPRNILVDHINGDRWDNRRCNLRLCTHQQNQWNRIKPPKNCNSGVIGVHRIGNRYRATIRENGVRRYLGAYATLDEAAAVRRAAELRIFGEFAPKREAVHAQ